MMVQPSSVAVHAANINGNPSTVRPIPAIASKDSNSAGGRSTTTTTSRHRLPFLPLPSRRNSRRAAKEAYLLYIQNELDAAQRQLYVSQNTCTTLRKRWEDQRRETLELMTSRSTIRDAAAIVEQEERQQEIQDQKEEIKQLQGQLQTETDKYEQQVERLDLLAAELNELQVWKQETQQEQSNDEGKILEYEQQLQDSHQKQSDYAEQVELLALKLEAAELAAKQHSNQQGEEEGEAPWERRAQSLRTELESVRAKYSKMLLHSLKGDSDNQQQVEEEMDKAVQTAVESALETIEGDWVMRYESLENQLNNMTGYVTSLEGERDAALGQVREAQTLSSVQPDMKHDDDDTTKLLKRKELQLREELTTELTDVLTEELTEKLTTQLTETLSENIEKKYKKKIKRLRQELKNNEQQQQQKVSEGEQSQQDLAEQQKKQIIEDEIKKVKEQYELEYESKLHQLQEQNKEQVQVQKERMRKLVKALLDREANKKGEKKNVGGKTKQKVEKTKTKPRKKRKEGAANGDSGSHPGGNGEDEELIPVSALTSRKQTARSRPGVVPVRGNR